MHWFTTSLEAFGFVLILAGIAVALGWGVAMIAGAVVGGSVALVAAGAGLIGISYIIVRRGGTK